MPPRKPKPKKPPTPRAAKAWDVRPTQSIGSASEDDVYLSVGKALSQWEGIEVQLAQLFQFFMGHYYHDPERHRVVSSPSRRAYGSVTNFATRIEMVENAGDSFFHATPSHGFHLKDRQTERWIVDFEANLAKNFEVLMDEVRGFAARRNDIAHGIVHGSRNIAPPHKPWTYFLSPPYYNAKKYPRPRDGKRRTVFEAATYHYTAQDIDYYCDCFIDLRKRLLAFLSEGEKVLSHDRSRERERAQRSARAK